ncbi:MAG: hypothetical protein HZC40_21405 [Chloroflexi bacterium]|nr:hypothetical protein [Chloroflexota bacterium]
MKKSSAPSRKISEPEIDQIVAAQADDDAAWEKPIRVRRKKSASVMIPAELAARAEFLARVHRRRSIADWLTDVIQERVELEEAAFVGAKRELVTRNAV